MRITSSVHNVVIGCVVASGAVLYAVTQQGLGYKDTPQIPGTNWCVHDGDRPQPRVVESGSAFSQGASPPADATVLFDGKDLSHWTDTRGRPVAWRVDSNELYMECTRGSGNIRSKNKFADFQLHLEFATPSPPRGTSQGRGNSGLLINGMYEVQVLDSYQDKTYPDGQCGALYGQTPPLVNACKAPGQWQTYDIIFESPRWDESGTLTKRTNVTVIQNGIALHHKHEFIGATDGVGGIPHSALGAYLKPHAPDVSIELQDHGNPIRYRNIWIRALGNYDQS